MTPRGFLHRLYSDCVLPSRMQEYRQLLLLARQYGYQILGVQECWQVLRRGPGTPDGRYLVLRHDIDSGVPTARLMFAVERDLEIRSSYYFRLSTLDIPLMKEIEGFGGEASYHFEEIASVAKRKRLKTRNEVMHALPEMRDVFRRNLEVLRNAVGASMRVVASHGDWANRRLGIPNWVLLEERDFRRDVGVDLEVYDEEFMRCVGSRHSDLPYPVFWKNGPPADAIRAGIGFVYLLVHPAHWRAEPIPNLIEDVKRLWEGLAYWS